MTITTHSPERNDLLETLAAHRGFLRQTAAGLTDEQARLRPTASALSIGGILKHLPRPSAVGPSSWSTAAAPELPPTLIGRIRLRR